jgi:nucleotide-binding universal stress UspA family protein
VYERMLVPLDGSESAEAALPLAELIPSRYVRLFAVEPVTLSAARKRWALDELAPDGSSWLVSTPADYLDLAGYRFRSRGRFIEVAVATGKPGSRIVEEAAAADLIVMAMRGEGLNRLLTGGTTDHVVRHAGIPTLLVRDDQAGLTVALLRFVVPLDGSEVAEEAVDLAKIVQQELGTALHLVRVVEPGGSIAMTDALVHEAATYLDQLIKHLGDEPNGADYEVLVGSPGEQIVQALRPGDLVVMTTHGIGGLGRRLLGSVTAAVVDAAEVPVVLIRAESGEVGKAFGRGDAKND